ncbi:MAG: GNAT family N-acetyltransferase [Cytophagales bacterium]|nr:GNAT family N-acetyltransferase [Cytophagales bacterium]
MDTKYLPITLQQALIKDLPKMQELFVDTIRSICIGEYTPSQIQAWTSSVENRPSWEEIMATQTVLLAFSEHTLVGFGSLASNSHIDLLYVHKNYQRKGIAQQLLDALEQMAIQQGSQELTSHVSKTAFPFFTKNGFIPLQLQQVERQGVILENYAMAKKLLA